MNTAQGKILGVNRREVNITRGARAGQTGIIYDIQFSDGKTYTTWNGELAAEAEKRRGGDAVIGFEVSHRGDFVNYDLKSVVGDVVNNGDTQTTVDNIPVAQEPQYYKPRHPDEAANINRQSALGTAFQYAAEAGLGVEEAFALADRIYEKAMGINDEVEEPTTVPEGSWNQS